MSHILCSTDGSDASTRAVEFASALASKLAAKLTIVAVIPFTVGRGVMMPMWEDGRANKILDEAKAVAEKAGAKSVDLKVAEAHEVASAILNTAERVGADQIVVGSGGKSAAKRFLIGSVSAEVVGRSHIPVTVVH